MSPQYEDKTPGTLPSQLSEQKLKRIQRGTWNTWNVENLKLSQQIGLACYLPSRHQDTSLEITDVWKSLTLTEGPWMPLVYSALLDK